MLFCSLPSGAGAPLRACKCAAMQGSEAQAGNHAGSASWAPRRARAFLAAVDACVPGRSRKQSLREASISSPSERDDCIDVEAQVHPSEDEEESLLLELAERLALPLTTAHNCRVSSRLLPIPFASRAISFRS